MSIPTRLELAIQNAERLSRRATNPALAAYYRDRVERGTSLQEQTEEFLDELYET